jgi:hypothetical protein
MVRFSTLDDIPIAASAKECRASDFRYQLAGSEERRHGAGSDEEVSRSLIL